LRRVFRVLDQARFALDKRLTDRSALLIVQFEFQVVVPGRDEFACLRSNQIRRRAIGGLFALAKLLSFLANSIGPRHISRGAVTSAQKAVSRCERRWESGPSSA
jgi:hypothetical protein